MRATPILPVLALAALVSCAPQPRTAAPSTPIPAGTPGQAVAGTTDCVELSRIREARVQDDQTIDFVMIDGRTYRNTLPYRCPQLGFERAFTYSTSISRLCRVDIITVINQGGGVRTGASCGLGDFVPYTAPPAVR